MPVSSLATAEAVKLTENIFRAVNIALVNELKVVYAAMGIDVWEVIDAAKTKPFGFMPFYPGPVSAATASPSIPSTLPGRRENTMLRPGSSSSPARSTQRMPHYVVERVAEAIDRRLGRALSQAEILVLGLAYKKNVDDTRESPALKLIELLEQRGARVDYHDPHVPLIPPTREHPGLTGRQSIALDAHTIGTYDAVLIVTDHDAVDYRWIAEHARIVVDTRNVCHRAKIQG